MKCHALRLRPGQDVKYELAKYAKEKNIRAACVVTCVGSLRQAAIRFANQEQGTTIVDTLEIVSLVGTLASDNAHLHISLSDGQGKTVGGHMLDGCLVYTTAEIVIGELEDLAFTREPDAESGYQELMIRPARNKKARKKKSQP